MSKPTPVAWLCVGSDGVSDVTQRADIADQWRDDGLAVTALYPSSALQTLEEENERLRAGEAFTLSDVSRLLRKQDVQGVCPNPDDCFYFGDRVRCGPCAVKASAAKGIVVDDAHSHLPEVCRLRREVKAAEARLKEALKVIEPFAKAAGRFEGLPVSEQLPQQCWFTPADLRAARRFMEENR